MDYYLRFIHSNKWFNFEQHDQFKEIPENEAPAVNINGIGNLTNNEMSVYESNGDLDDMYLTGATQALKLDRVKLIGAVLIPKEYIEKNKFRVESKVGDTPIFDINIRHRNISYLSTDDANSLINEMYTYEYVKLPDKILLDKINSLFKDGAINESDIKDNLKDRLGIKLKSRC